MALSFIGMDSNLTSRYTEDAQYKAISGTLVLSLKIHLISGFSILKSVCGLRLRPDGNAEVYDGLVVENALVSVIIQLMVLTCPRDQDQQLKTLISVGMVMMV